MGKLQARAQAGQSVQGVAMSGHHPALLSVEETYTSLQDKGFGLASSPQTTPAARATQTC